MILKSGKIEEFAGLSQFETIMDFHQHMEKWLLVHKHDFSKGEIVGLKRLVLFSSEIPGVCNTAIGTMLTAIQSEFYEHSISRSTFKRMILKAKKLGIITVFETERANKSQSK